MIENITPPPLNMASCATNTVCRAGPDQSWVISVPEPQLATLMATPNTVSHNASSSKLPVVKLSSNVFYGDWMLTSIWFVIKFQLPPSGVSIGEVNAIMVRSINSLLDFKGKVVTGASQGIGAGIFSNSGLLAMPLENWQSINVDGGDTPYQAVSILCSSGFRRKPLNESGRAFGHLPN